MTVVLFYIIDDGISFIINNTLTRMFELILNDFKMYLIYIYYHLNQF